MTVASPAEPVSLLGRLDASTALSAHAHAALVSVDGYDAVVLIVESGAQWAREARRAIRSAGDLGIPLAIVGSGVPVPEYVRIARELDEVARVIPVLALSVDPHDDVLDLAPIARTVDDADGVADALAELLVAVPRNAFDGPGEPAGEPSATGLLPDVVPEDAREGWDVLELVDAVVDEDTRLSLSSDECAVVHGFATVREIRVGYLATQPLHRLGEIATDDLPRARAFIALCARFRLPLVVVLDLPPQPDSEQRRHALRLARELAGSTGPRILILPRGVDALPNELARTVDAIADWAVTLRHGEDVAGDAAHVESAELAGWVSTTVAASRSKVDFVRLRNRGSVAR